MQSLSELVERAESFGIGVKSSGTDAEELGAEADLLAIVQWLAERGVAVYLEYDKLWCSHREGGFYRLLPVPDFRTAVLAAFSLELDRMESPDAR